MREFYDVFLLGIFIVLICLFMVCCQKKSRRATERNAKIFERVGSGESELEYEDIQSSEMDNDNNDLLESGQKALKAEQKKRKLFSKKPKAKDKYNDIQVCDDDKSEDVFSDSTDDEMSMERMREEYYKSQTLAKKFGDFMDDIWELLNGGKEAVQKTFKKKKPMIVRPMIMSIDDKTKKSEKDSIESEESDEKVQEDSIK